MFFRSTHRMPVVLYIYLSCGSCGSLSSDSHNMLQNGGNLLRLAQVSDFFFSKLPVGNDFFLLGLPLVYFPEAIQWIQFTGPYILSFWAVMAGYLLYRIFTAKTRQILVYLAIVIILPIGLSSLIQKYEASFPLEERIQTSVVAMGLADSDNVSFVTSLFKNFRLQGNDYLLLPEAFIYEKAADIQYAPVSTMLKRLSKRDSISIIYGVMTYQEHEFTNAVKMVSSDGDEKLRYKSHMVPFSEYLPLPALFGRFSLFSAMGHPFSCF